MTACLNVSLRERNALVYTVESMAQSYSDTGLWAVYFGCDPKNVKRCLRGADSAECHKSGKRDRP